MVKVRKTVGKKPGGKKSAAKAKPAGKAKPKPKAKARPKAPAKAAPKAKKPPPKAAVAKRPKAAAPPLKPAARPGPIEPPARPIIAEPEAPVAAPPPRPPVKLDPTLRAEVAAALARNGYDDPEPEVITTLTAVAAGYRKGPADAPPAMAAYADKSVADAMVDLFTLGDKSPVVGRRMARPAVRATVDFDLRQLGPDETGDAEREVLMGLCLGIWDPDRDTFAQRDGIAAFVGRWYRAGLS